MQSIFFRCILPAGQGPDLGDTWSQVRLIRDRLKRWQAGECGPLWAEAIAGQEKNMGRGTKRRGAPRMVILSQEEKNAQRCKSKAHEGQYSRAVQALVSCGLAECSPETLFEMQQKHPPPKRPQPNPPDLVSAPRSFSPAEVSVAALSFPKGSGAGPSGMRPEHFKSVLKNTSAALANKALGALTKLVNTLAAGKVPEQVRPFLCGARLVAGKKKDNSLRPIAIGNLLRRVVSKCFNNALAQKAADLLAPNQLGVGVRGGAEAIAHAVTEAVKVHPSSWVLQADLVNAYNSVDRGVMLEEVARYFPECLSWAKSCYGAPSWLKFGEASIFSATGLHQGDPIAGLLFCLVLKPIVDAIESEVADLILNAWYLDDGHIIGTKEELASVVDIIVREGESRGLILSRAATVHPPSLPKSVVWSPLDGIGDNEQDPLLRGIPKVKAGDGIVVLGAPVGYHAFVKEKLKSKVEKVRGILELLPLLQDPHCEFVLLRSCLSLPKIMFMLRAVNTVDFQDQLIEFDCLIRGALSHLLGSPLTDVQWAQASLPVAMGGLGFRSAADHASAAHAVSLLAAQPLLDGLLGEDSEEPQLPQPLLDKITAKTGETASVDSLQGISQREVSLKVDLLNQSLLLHHFNEEGEEREIARMASLGLPHAGSWLSVVPSPALGLHLRAPEFIPVLKYRLGLPILSENGLCAICSQPSDRMGDHALGCRTSSDRIARHNMLRDVIFEAAASADLGPTREERQLLPGTSARPGDVMIRRWASGKDAVIDVTVTGPLAASNVSAAAAEAGAALTKACQRKLRETAEACRQEGLVFLPFAMETLGGLHSGAVTQVRQIAATLARSKGLPEGEVTGQLFGRLSLTLMRGNAQMLASRCQEDSRVPPQVDGVM